MISRTFTTFISAVAVGGAWAPEPASAEDLAQQLPQLPPDGGPVEVADLELESLLELAVTAATKQPVRQSDAPSTASVLVRDQIRDFGWDSLNELLYTLPGFAPSQDYERRTAGFRGEREPWNNNRLHLAWDGMPHNGIETGSASTWEATPLYFARRVEVVRGPASAIYGGGALHGVLAIESVSAADLGDGGVQARLRAGPRTRSIDAVGAQKGAAGEAVIGVRGHGTLGDEYLSTDDSGRLAEDGTPARFMVQDEQNSTYLWLKAEPSAVPGLRLQLHREMHDAETGRGWFYWAPDLREHVTENRTIADLTHQHRAGRLTFEQALQFQHQRYKADIRYYPAGAFDGYYPDGVSEVTDTAMQALMARSQLHASLGGGAGLLAGVEYGGVVYRGDREHYANALLVDPAEEYPQLDGFEDQGPTYEPILDRPVHRLGGYAQLVTGDLFGEKVELTAGARYDALLYSYEDVLDPARPERSGSHSRLSPRGGLVLRPAEPLRLKLMVGHAYRTPTLVEMFSANSWAALSNPDGLEPEHATTYEVGADLAATASLRLRANGFLVRHANVIDYTAGGVLENRYSNRRAGAEIEVLAERRVGPVKLDGSASYSHVRLLGETLADPDMAPSEVLVWAPAHLFKASLRALTARFGGTLTAYAQGTARRRTSDRMDESFRTLRPASVPAWFQLDTHLFVKPTGGVRLGVQGKNILGTAGGLIAPGDHGFDYRMPPREVMAVVELEY